MPRKMKKTLQRRPFICLQIKLQKNLIKAFIFHLGSILKHSITKSPKESAFRVLRTWAARLETKGAGSQRRCRLPCRDGGQRSWSWRRAPCHQKSDSWSQRQSLTKLWHPHSPQCKLNCKLFLKTFSCKVLGPSGLGLLIHKWGS